MRRDGAAVWLLGLLALTACGAHEPGDAARGAQLFASEELGGSQSEPGCISCHTVTPGEPPAIGPNLSDVGATAATTLPGKSAEEYLRESIVEPDAYLADGYQEGIHPRTYGRTLTATQIHDLVAYLLTLRGGVE